MMMNGDLIKKAISIDKGSFLHQVAGDGKLNNAAKINHLYMAALARKPTSSEVGMANQIDAASQGGRSRRVARRVVGAAQSNEFILNH